jgi:hypothetical protein
VLPPQWRPAASGLEAWLTSHGVQFAQVLHFDRVAQTNWLLFLLALCWLAPNTQQLLATYRPALMTPGYDDLGDAGRLAWRPSRAWLVAVVLLGAVGLLSVHRYSEFIYFRF